MVQNVSTSPIENGPTPESIQMLRRKLTASRALSKALLQEQKRNEAILQQLRSITGTDGDHSLGFLTSSTGAKNLGVSSGGQALSTNTTFAMSQLPALKSLLAELRPRLTSLKDSSASYESAKDELRQERREYIEQRTKAHLQRNGESLADNASALPTHALDADEIQALDKVAQSFNPP